jgi:hypothetical protein
MHSHVQSVQGRQDCEAGKGRYLIAVYYRSQAPINGVFEAVRGAIAEQETKHLDITFPFGGVLETAHIYLKPCQ